MNTEAFSKPYVLLSQTALGDYEAKGFDTLKEAVHGATVGAFVVVRKIEWEVVETGSQPAGQAAAPKPARNRLTPEQRESMLIFAADFIRVEGGGPCTTAQIHAGMGDNLGTGFDIGTATTLGALLQAAKGRFVSHGRKGWTLVEADKFAALIGVAGTMAELMAGKAPKPKAPWSSDPPTGVVAV